MREGRNQGCIFWQCNNRSIIIERQGALPFTGAHTYCIPSTIGSHPSQVEETSSSAAACPNAHWVWAPLARLSGYERPIRQGGSFLPFDYILHKAGTHTHTPLLWCKRHETHLVECGLTPLAPVVPPTWQGRSDFANVRSPPWTITTTTASRILQVPGPGTRAAEEVRPRAAWPRGRHTPPSPLIRTRRRGPASPRST